MSAVEDGDIVPKVIFFFFGPCLVQQTEYYSRKFNFAPNLRLLGNPPLQVGLITFEVSGLNNSHDVRWYS